MLDCDICRFSWKMSIKVKKIISWKFIYIFLNVGKLFWHFYFIFLSLTWFFLNIESSWIVTHEHKSRSPCYLLYFKENFGSLLQTIYMKGLIWVRKNEPDLIFFFRFDAKTKIVGLWHLRSTEAKNPNNQIWMDFQRVILIF